MPAKKIDLIAYSTDASMIKGEASGVVFPDSADKIRNLIVANSNLVVRGGGSGLVGGAVPLNSLVIDMSKMNKILNFDEAKKTVEVEAGIILDELNNFLEKYHLEFPVKPSSHAICTIGGMISTNAVGNRAIKYGRTSNWIESLEAVNGKGEILEIRKTDLSDFAGMEGITGIIVKAKLVLVDRQRRTASLLPLKTLDDVINYVNKLKLLNEVCAIEFLDKISSSILGLEDKYHLLIEFESLRGELKDGDYEKIMNLRDSLYPALASAGFTHIEDPKIMLNRFKEFAELLETEKVPYFGHLGVGIIHPVLRAEDAELAKRIIEYAKKLHGQVSGEHGIGLSKKDFLDANDQKLIERIKSRHDHSCKINCNKVIKCQ